MCSSPRQWRLALSLAALALAQLTGCAGDSIEEIPLPGPAAEAWLELPESGRPWNLLVITLDTTRRDRLGCYGHEGGLTPNLDRLARRGVLFEHAVSPVPITLPSHATLFTGLNPQEHGVRSNTTFTLAPESRTLAEILGKHGFATGATVGAAPVARGCGLAQGFDHYDDDFSAGAPTGSAVAPERRANQVTARAQAWIAEQGPGPFFHWCHYFDPHFPYAPPPDQASAGRSAYDGEVAFMDAQIGVLIRGLERRGLIANTWILCVADHGEALGDHGEPTHTMFLYGATQHVPCILVPPGAWSALGPEQMRGRRFGPVVGLASLASTLLNALGLPDSERLGAGGSLLPALAEAGSCPPVVYLETLAPYLDMGWSELRGVRASRWSYIRAPRPELYDLEADAAEERNLIGDHPEVAARLSRWCDAFLELEAGAAPQPPSEEQLSRLRSLGYLGAGASLSTGAPPDEDPKDRIHIFRRIQEANAVLEPDPAAALRILAASRDEDPHNPTLLRMIARAGLGLRDWRVAREASEALLILVPTDLEAQANLGWALTVEGDLRAAQRVLEGVLREDPAHLSARSHLAVLEARAGRIEEAGRLLQETIDLSPGQADPVGQLAVFEWDHGDRARAATLAEEALTLHARQPEALVIRGESLLQEALKQTRAGNEQAAAEIRHEALASFERALAVSPHQPTAAHRVAALAESRGDSERAEALYRRSLVGRPGDMQVHIRLADLLRKTERYDEARAEYAHACSLGCREARVWSNYGVVLVMGGRREEARHAWRTALGLDPDVQLAAGIRRNLATLDGP